MGRNALSEIRLSFSNLPLSLLNLPSHCCAREFAMIPHSFRQPHVEGRLAVFDDVWETIQERYYDPRFHGIDWQAKRTTFRPVAARAGNTQEFYEVLRQMIASLRDAHTRVYSPDEKFDWWSPRFVTVGLTIREVEGAPTVIQVEADSAASQTDIRQGDVIVSVDDVPVADFVAQRHAQLTAWETKATFAIA